MGLSTTQGRGGEVWTKLFFDTDLFLSPGTFTCVKSHGCARKQSQLWAIDKEPKKSRSLRDTGRSFHTDNGQRRQKQLLKGGTGERKRRNNTKIGSETKFGFQLVDCWRPGERAFSFVHSLASEKFMAIGSRWLNLIRVPDDSGTMRLVSRLPSVGMSSA